MSIDELPSNVVRGRQQLSIFNLPAHGDIVDDMGQKWEIRMNGGFQLRRGRDCHPDFLNGPMDAWHFAAWFNKEYGNEPAA